MMSIPKSITAERSILIDKKGKWLAGYLRRIGLNQFWMWLELESEKVHKFGQVYGTDESDAFHFKKQIQREIGYTPTQPVLKQLFERFKRLRDEFREEDAHYAQQDKEAAGNRLRELHELGIQRFIQNEAVPEAYYGQRRSDLQRYFSREEVGEIGELIKTINGHGFEAPSSGPRSGHLSSFENPFREAIEFEKLRKEHAEKEARNHRILELLDTDSNLRKLAVQALAAERTSSTTLLYTELAQRLFGYVKNLEGYREIHTKLEDVLKPYGLHTFESNELVYLANEYLLRGGTLPAFGNPHYERAEGAIYYHDLVQRGNERARVEAVGRIYIKTSKGKWKKTEVIRL